MFKLVETPVNGLKLMRPQIRQDERGELVKTFSAALFSESGIDFSPAEQFLSVSKKNVLRGLHFQNPPSDHNKLVFCSAGRVLDVVIDLRPAQSYGRIFSCEISRKEPSMLFIPKGCAHGFLALEDGSEVLYLTDSVHDPRRDSGILWSSIDFDWGISTPIVSERDAKFCAWSKFDSPFA